MTIIAYARFSSGSQNEGSIARQFKAAKEFAAARNWTIDEFVSDEAKSAFSGKHMQGELGSIFKRVAAGKLGSGDTIIVENLDRLSREAVTDAMFSMMTLMQSGMTVITTHDQKILTKANYDSEVGDMFDTLIKIRVANEESEKKRLRQSSNWQKWREQGILTHRNPFWIAKDRTVIEDRALLVRRIFEMSAKGMGATRIAATLTEEGLFAFGKIQNKEDGKAPFTGATISKLLRNRSVLGEYQARSKGEPVGAVVVDYYPQIISHELFNEVNADIKTRRFRESGGKVGEGNIFKSLLRCVHCKSRMTLHSINYVRHYRCRLGAIKGCENKRLWNAEMLEKAFLQTIQEIEIKSDEPTRLVELREEKSRLESHIETAKANASRAYDMWFSNPNSVTAKAKLDEFEASVVSMSERLIAVDEEIGQTAKPDNVHAQVKSLWTTFEERENKREFREQMNVLLKRLVRHMTLSEFGSFVFALNDNTTYRMQYELRPDAAPRKAGSRPLSDFVWQLKGRMTEKLLEETLRSMTIDQKTRDFVES
ncbi:recombinase family protein [Brevundimonas olei]|uniref:recombinase family protein n=1 Tax=Brevundimonas olei TaxID=657642 RepID=UPI0031E140BC